MTRAESERRRRALPRWYRRVWIAAVLIAALPWALALGLRMMVEYVKGEIAQARRDWRE